MMSSPKWVALVRLFGWMMIESERTLIGILLSICGKHLSGSDSDWSAKTEQLVDELLLQGFDRETALCALNWLAELTTPTLTADMQATSTRVLSENERMLLPEKDIKLLFFMEKEGLIPPEIREQVITSVLSVYQLGVRQSVLLWVTYLVLCADPALDERRQRMELMLVEKCRGGVH